MLAYNAQFVIFIAIISRKNKAVAVILFVGGQMLCFLFSQVLLNKGNYRLRGDVGNR